MGESKRVRKFRLTLAREIPKFPNNKTSLQALEAKSLGSLLIDYANWASRYVAPRPRAVVVEAAAANDPRWQLFSNDIQALLKKVKMGDDLTPYLSLHPHTRGFTPAASAPGPNVDRWADKDMLLNATGHHHFHLDAAPSDQMRSNILIFAHVTRDVFTVIGLFDHDVFKGASPSTALTAERERFWKIFDDRLTHGRPPGLVVIATPITTSGHSLGHTHLAMNYARVIKETDPKLDDPLYVQSLYKKTDLPVPIKPKLEWRLQYLTLGLLDKNIGAFFVLCKGPN